VNQQAISPAPPSIALPLFLWLLIQLFALMLAAARVPLTAGLGPTPEELSLRELLAIDLISAGMLFPFLLRTWSATLVLVASCAPFMCAAGLFSGSSTGALLAGWSYLALWLVALRVWYVALPSRAHLCAVAVLNVFTVGLPILDYLHREFSPQSRWRAQISPVASLLEHMDDAQISLAWWLPVLVPLAAGSALLWWSKWGLRDAGGGVSQKRK
jgi:hypothetical protein